MPFARTPAPGKFHAVLAQIWTGGVLQVLFSVLLAFSLSWLAGGLEKWIAWTSLAAGFVAMLVAMRKVRWASVPQQLEPDSWFWRWFVQGSFLLFALRAFLWLIFEKDGHWNVLSPNNLGDLPKHIQYIRFLAGGAELWPVNPLHAHSMIGYSFGLDLFNALLEVCGVPLNQGLIGCGLIGCLLTGIALYRWGGTFGMAAFLFNGGLIGYLFFTSGKWIDYQQTVDWKSLPLALLVTQRGFLYALPAGLLLLTQWRKSYTSNDETAPILPLPIEWLLYATMPLFHLHTFLFLTVILGTLAIFGEQRRRIWQVIGLSIPPATALVLLLTDNLHSGSHLSWQPGWMQGAEFSLSYWALNFGALPVFWLALFILLVLRRPFAGPAVLLVSPAMLIFLATLFWKFAPWAWDNTKLMMWSYLVIMPFLWSEMVALCPWITRATVCFLLFFSGFLSLWGGLGPQFTGNQLVSRSDVEDVEMAVKNVPREAVFACSPDYAHPLVFNGRRLALAYTGHLAGHGIDYHWEEKAVNDLMDGTSDWRAAATFLKAEYLYWGPAEKKRWPRSSQPWAAKNNQIAAGTWGEIYRLNP